MAGPPTDFNNCVSKGELTSFITKQHNLMNKLTHNVNNLVTRIEQIEQRPQSHRGDDEDVNGDLFDHEDVDDDGDARNCRHYNFKRRSMGGNNHGNNDPFAKIKVSLPPFVGNVDPKVYLVLGILNIIKKSILSFLILITVPKMPNLSLIPLKPSCHPRHDMRDVVLKYAIALLNK